MARIVIPGWVNTKTGETHPHKSFNAELIEVLLANSAQPRELINKYYGETPPKGAFYPAKHDRLIFQRDDGAYVIIPNTPSNKPLWSQ